MKKLHQVWRFSSGFSNVFRTLCPQWFSVLVEFWWCLIAKKEMYEKENAGVCICMDRPARKAGKPGRGWQCRGTPHFAVCASFSKQDPESFKNPHSRPGILAQTCSHKIPLNISPESPTLLAQSHHKNPTKSPLQPTTNTAGVYGCWRWPGMKFSAEEHLVYDSFTRYGAEPTSKHCLS